MRLRSGSGCPTGLAACRRRCSRAARESCIPNGIRLAIGVGIEVLAVEVTLPWLSASVPKMVPKRVFFVVGCLHFFNRQHLIHGRAVECAVFGVSVAIERERAITGGIDGVVFDQRGIFMGRIRYLFRHQPIEHIVLIGNLLLPVGRLRRVGFVACIEIDTLESVPLESRHGRYIIILESRHCRVFNCPLRFQKRSRHYRTRITEKCDAPVHVLELRVGLCNKADFPVGLGGRGYWQKIAQHEILVRRDNQLRS